MKQGVLRGIIVMLIFDAKIFAFLKNNICPLRGKPLLFL
jgi:hypothetical protein